jgi:hypothetical protein
VLSFERHNRFGELYRMLDGDTVAIAGRDWLRTRFQYAWKEDKGDAPETATGIEYAIAAGERLYVVTLHGSDASTRWLEKLVASTLRSPASRRRCRCAGPAPAGPEEVVRRPCRRWSWSPAAWTAGCNRCPAVRAPSSPPAAQLLTTSYVIHDGAPTAATVHRRFRAETEPGMIVCGPPGKIDADLDLALIKLNMDLDGQLIRRTVAGRAHRRPRDGHAGRAVGSSATRVGGGASASTSEVTGLWDARRRRRSPPPPPSARSSGGAAVDETAC